MKGLCPLKEGKLIDRQYVLKPKVIVNGHPIWKGFASSLIIWNESLQHWGLYNRINNKLPASTKGDSPSGFHVWQLEFEDICADKPEGQELSLPDDEQMFQTGIFLFRWLLYSYWLEV